MEGEVVAVGPGKQAEGGKREPMEAKAGDRILFGRHCGTEIKIEDQDSVAVREEEILAALQEAAKGASR